MRVSRDFHLVPYVQRDAQKMFNDIALPSTELCTNWLTSFSYKYGPVRTPKAKHRLLQFPVVSDACVPRPEGYERLGSNG
jgi:hypothetical protein